MTSPDAVVAVLEATGLEDDEGEHTGKRHRAYEATIKDLFAQIDNLQKKAGADHAFMAKLMQERDELKKGRDSLLVERDDLKKLVQRKDEFLAQLDRESRIERQKYEDLQASVNDLSEPL